MLGSRLMIALVFLSITAQAQDYDKVLIKMDRKFFKLNDGVVSVKENRWIPSKENGAMEYDLKTPALDDSYVLGYSETAHFDKDGNMDEFTSNETSDDNSKREKDVKKRHFGYTDDKLTSIVNYVDYKRGDSLAFNYKKKGMIYNYQLFDGKNVLRFTVTFTYKNGQIFAARQKNGSNKAMSMIKYRYKDGKLIETKHFDADFKMTEVRRYSKMANKDNTSNESYAVFDANNNMMGGLSSTLDSAGNLLEKNVVDSDRRVSLYDSYVYDKYQNPVKEKIFSSTIEAVIVNRYSYDPHGNWIQKQIFKNDRLQTIIVRDIKYLD